MVGRVVSGGWSLLRALLLFPGAGLGGGRLLLPEDGVGVYAVHDVEVPYLDLRLHCPHRDVVASARRGAAAAGREGETEPFERERHAGQHEVVVDVHVLVVVLVDIALDVGDVVLDAAGQEEVVRRQDLEFLAVFVGVEAGGFGGGEGDVGVW